MDGLGLPVCWAACPGPNEGFATDGQSIVSIGGMEAPAEFLERNARLEVRQRPESVTATLSPGDEVRTLAILRRISALDGRGWRRFIAAFMSDGTEGRRTAARMIGVSRASFDCMESPQCRLVLALSSFDAEDFCVLRQRLAAANGSQAAAAMLVSRQAVSKREGKMRKKADWYADFLEKSNDSNGFLPPNGVISPKKQ